MDLDINLSGLIHEKSSKNGDIRTSLKCMNGSTFDICLETISKIIHLDWTNQNQERISHG